jgi:hypothetical protein
VHHDDSIQAVSIAGRDGIVVPCDERGRCDPARVAAAWTGGPAFVWLSPDGTAPSESLVRRAPTDVVSATLAPVVDAVKRVDDVGTIVETVDRSDLSNVLPPALIPRSVVDTALASKDPGSLLHVAVGRAGVAELRTES